VKLKRKRKKDKAPVPVPVAGAVVAAPVRLAPLMTERDDRVQEFVSSLLRTEKDGPALVQAVSRLIARHNPIARQVVSAGTLGRVVSYPRAVAAVRTYADTGVAVTPETL